MFILNKYPNKEKNICQDIRYLGIMYYIYKQIKEHIYTLTKTFKQQVYSSLNLYYFNYKNDINPTTFAVSFGSFVIFILSGFTFNIILDVPFLYTEDVQYLPGAK